jgi:hypothetical protein
MGWQPGSGSGMGASPDREPEMPGGASFLRDPRLAEFASDGGWARWCRRGGWR